jgi:hypothetical protein|tara:strand:- start:945 stop:1049 length:105 start_codon:yes stop_codon:yes gene_type:complete
VESKKTALQERKEMINEKRNFLKPIDQEELKQWN